MRQKCVEYKSEEKNDMGTNNKPLDTFKHAWPAGIGLTVGDSVPAGIDEE